MPCRAMKNNSDWKRRQRSIVRGYAVLTNTAPFRLDKSRKVLPSLRFAETPQDDDILEGLGIRSRSLRGNPRHIAVLPRAARRTWEARELPRRRVRPQAGHPEHSQARQNIFANAAAAGSKSPFQHHAQPGRLGVDRVSALELHTGDGYDARGAASLTM